MRKMINEVKKKKEKPLKCDLMCPDSEKNLEKDK